MFYKMTYSRDITQFVNAYNKKKERLALLLSMNINDEKDASYSVEMRFLTF